MRRTHWFDHQLVTEESSAGAAGGGGSRGQQEACKRQAQRAQRAPHESDEADAAQRSGHCMKCARGAAGGTLSRVSCWYTRVCQGAAARVQPGDQTRSAVHTVSQRTPRVCVRTAWFSHNLGAVHTVRASCARACARPGSVTTYKPGVGCDQRSACRGPPLAAAAGSGREHGAVHVSMCGLRSRRRRSAGVGALGIGGVVFVRWELACSGSGRWAVSYECVFVCMSSWNLSGSGAVANKSKGERMHNSGQQQRGAAARATPPHIYRSLLGVRSAPQIGKSRLRFLCIPYA